MSEVHKMTQNQSALPQIVTPIEDEIDLIDLISNIWKQRGLVAGVALMVLLAVLSFHLYKASFSAPSRVDYSISVNFLNDKGQYPNGSAFSPRDLISSRVLNAVVSKYNQISVDNLAKALSVDYSNALLEQSEKKLSSYLIDAKTPEEVRISANKVLESMREQTHSVITLRLSLEKSDLSVEEGQAVVVELVDTWALQSIDRGLMNVDITRPAASYSDSGSSNFIDIFEGMTKYVESLNKSINQLEELSGSQSLIVDGQTLSDIKRNLQTLETVEIDPLRSFAYSNSAALATKQPSIRIRLMSRKRLLSLEHDRLTKLIASYDSNLSQLAQVDKLDASAKQGASNSQVIGSQMDQSFLNSLLELGNKLSNVEVREDLFKKRIDAIESILNLEKEIAVLNGSDDAIYKNFDASTVLSDAIRAITPELNLVQKQLSGFIDAYREQSLRSGARLYVADAAPQVRGGGLQIAKKAALTIALGLVLGLMLGVMVALVRAAMINSRKV